MPPMHPDLVTEVHRLGRMDDHLISTTRMVDENDKDVWFLVFEYNLDGKQGYLLNLKCLFVWKYTQYIFFPIIEVSEQARVPGHQHQGKKKGEDWWWVVSNHHISRWLRRFLEIILRKKNFWPETLPTSNSAILMYIHTYIHTYLHSCIYMHRQKDTKVQRYMDQLLQNFFSHYWLQCLLVLQPQMAHMLIKWHFIITSAMTWLMYLHSLQP